MEEYKTLEIHPLAISPKGGTSFRFLIHRHESAETLALSLEDFYKPHGRTPLTFPHYEIEIISPIKDEMKKWIHFKETKDGRKFICWPHNTPTKEAAMRLVEGFSAVTHYSITWEEDSNLVIGRYCHPEAAINHLEGLATGLLRDHQIRVDHMA